MICVVNHVVTTLESTFSFPSGWFMFDRNILLIFPCMTWAYSPRLFLSALSVKSAAVVACKVHRLAIRTSVRCGRPCFPEQMHWDALGCEVANTDLETSTSSLHWIAASNTARRICWHGCSMSIESKSGRIYPQKTILCFMCDFACQAKVNTWNN